ncbi:hypothetical protein V1477_010109 [Vespula maculifrons]
MTKYLATCCRSSLPNLIGIQNEKRIELSNTVSCNDKMLFLSGDRHQHEKNYSEADRGYGEIIERNELIPNMSSPKGETESSSYVPFPATLVARVRGISRLVEIYHELRPTVCRGQVEHPSGYKHSELSTASNYRVKPKCRGKISPGFDP